VYKCGKGPKIHTLSPGSQKTLLYSWERDASVCVSWQHVYYFIIPKISDEFSLIAIVQHINCKHVQCLEILDCKKYEVVGERVTCITF
jgi:hypothetical protein